MPVMPDQRAATASDLDLAVIGNGRVAALVDRRGRIVWWCFPRFDGDPVFSRLLAHDEEKGFCDVVLSGAVQHRAAYARNTAIVETVIEDAQGNRIRITDFCPRFLRYERMFHPPVLVRRIEPLAGVPRIAIRVRPTFNFGMPGAVAVPGSNHIRYTGGRDTLRLTTDAPLSYVTQETPFALVQPLTLVLGPDEPVEASIDALSRDHLERTRDYWHQFVRLLSVPLEWQAETIRAAITLKLCNFDETGAIIAAHTTSIPEAAGTPRTWDYRYCWLRDAYFVIKALNRLGATQTMEGYLNYITTIAVDTETPLRPVYGIVHDEPLPERYAEHLKGFNGMGPVRIGNEAATQLQHDSCGSIILGVSQMFIDERLPTMGDAALFRRLEPLGHQAMRLGLQPDAGPWEYRGRARIHTHSATMCWVAADRLARIARRLALADRAAFWRDKADALKAEILARAWNPERGAITGAFDDGALDASVLLSGELGLLAPGDERFHATCRTIGRELMRSGAMMRYVTEDDFGAPETAFLACQFWYMDALALMGRTEEARELFSDILARRNSFGLLSEDLDPRTGRLWGNIPQTYSMAGIVNTGKTLSRRWDAAWALDT